MGSTLMVEEEQELSSVTERRLRRKYGIATHPESKLRIKYMVIIVFQEHLQLSKSYRLNLL